MTGSHDRVPTGLFNSAPNSPFLDLLARLHEQESEQEHADAAAARSSSAADHEAARHLFNPPDIEEKS